MMTLIVLLAATLLVVAAGEAVRLQCRRMLDRPVRITGTDEVRADGQPAGAAMA